MPPKGFSIPSQNLGHYQKTEFQNHLTKRKLIMSKTMDAKKQSKKEPKKTLKEKRAEKKEKKSGK